MLLPLRFIPGIWGVLDEEEIEKCMENPELTERLRKSLYYGKIPTTDRPSLPVTEIAVEFFQEAAPRELGQVDTFIASSYGRRACMSPCSMMLGMLYIERLKKRNPEYLRNVSSSDLFLISMMTASKYLYDEGVDEEVFNDEWAESANMDLEQLNELERNFLMAIDWSLFVDPEEFWCMLQHVERRIAWSKGAEHGFFNYTDLLVLTENGMLMKTVMAIVAELSKILLVFSVAYTAGVLTVVGSTASVMYARQQLPAPTDINIGLPNWHSLTESVWCAQLHSAFDIAHPQILQPTSSKSPEQHAQEQVSSKRNKTDNNSVAVGNGSKTKDIAPERPFSGSLPFPGLLMYAVMLKDTVFQFASGLRTKSSTNGHSTDTSRPLKTDTVYSDIEDDLRTEMDTVDVTENIADLSDVVCSCGCCGQNFGYDKLCYNLTSPFSNTMNIGLKNLHRPRLNLEQGHTAETMNMDNMNCSPDFSCQCCCASSPGPGRMRRANLFSPGALPFQRIEEPFAGMTFGFGTSSHSMAAAAG